jgi:hypothetical protein
MGGWQMRPWQCRGVEWEGPVGTANSTRVPRLPRRFRFTQCIGVEKEILSLPSVNQKNCAILPAKSADPRYWRRSS